MPTVCGVLPVRRSRIAEKDAFPTWRRSIDVRIQFAAFSCSSRMNSNMYPNRWRVAILSPSFGKFQFALQFLVIS